MEMVETIQGIADALGADWSVEPADGSDDMVLRRTNGEMIRVSRAGGRLTLRGEPGDLRDHWPRDGDGPLTHRITVSAVRPPAVLARAIETRLLPSYREARRSAVEHRMVTYPEQERMAAELASILHAVRLDRASDLVRRPGAALPGPAISGELRVDTTSVTFQLAVPRARAVALAACVAMLDADPQSLATEAHEHGRAACWYAWGAADHGVTLTGPAANGAAPALAFGLAYAAAHASTAAGGRAFLPSIQDAFALWQSGAEF